MLCAKFQIIKINCSGNMFYGPDWFSLHVSKFCSVFFYLSKRLAFIIFWFSLVTVLLAIAIPELDLFISLFGALCMASLGLIFPALFETCIFYNRKTGNAKLWMITKNVFIGLFGLSGALIGTTTSLIAIYAALYKKHA